MGSQNLHSPPTNVRKLGRQRNSTSSSSDSKSIPLLNRASQRPKSRVAAAHLHDHVARVASVNGRHKRVWKACERCRMKKTKCDGEFPCARCKNDGVICTTGVHKRVDYKQLPKGYAEVLENSQFALTATVYKLYSMVRNSQPWTLGEPKLNDHGQFVVHDIAQRLGCIRPNSEIDLPVHSVFPEDEAGMAEIARELDEQQSHSQLQQEEQHPCRQEQHDRHDRAFSSEIKHSDSEQDYGFAINSQNYSSETLGRRRRGARSSLTMSPLLAGTMAIDFGLTLAADIDTGTVPLSQDCQEGLQGCTAPPPNHKPGDFSLEFFQAELQALSVPNQALVDNDYGIKPDILSVETPQVTMVNDPLVYAAFDSTAMKL